jgi:protein arginine N-methyltransferase 5
MVSEWLELDAADDWVRHDAEMVRLSFSLTVAQSLKGGFFFFRAMFQALQQELAYASYLNIQTAILPAPRNRDHVASYARIVNACLKSLPYIYLSVRLPIYNPSAFQPSPPASALPPAPPSVSKPTLVVSDATTGRLTPSSEGQLNATWEMWDVIRSMCDYNTRLTLSKRRSLLLIVGDI